MAATKEDWAWLAGSRQVTTTKLPWPDSDDPDAYETQLSPELRHKEPIEDANGTVWAQTQPTGRIRFLVHANSQEALETALMRHLKLIDGDD